MNIYSILTQAIKDIENLPQYDGRLLDLGDQAVITSMKRNKAMLERRGRDKSQFLEDGREVDDQGRLIDPMGYLINDDGEKVDESGKLLEAPTYGWMSRRLKW